MRIGWIFSIVLVAASLSCGHAQLALGPSGLSTPPINIVSVFKFLRDIWLAYMYPAAADAVLLAKTEEKPELIPVIEEEEAESVDIVSPAEQRVSVMGYDTKGNIVEKFDSGCLDDGAGECDTPLANDAPPEDRLGSASSASQEVVEDKTGTSQVVVGKWSILYISLISVLFWLFVIVATPYILTGESIGRREDHDLSPNSIVDQQDILLLLSWLLGEVSDDVSCLEIVVCLTPTKSSRYIYVSSLIFNVASYLQRWVPYSRRFEDTLHNLEDVVMDGFSQECQDYSCPTINEL